MKKTISLNENRMFKKAYYRGRSIVSPVLITYMLKNHLDVNRIGVAASKKIGKAVVRNRAKRIIKAAYTQLEHTLPVGLDFVFVARGRTATLKTPQIEKAMQTSIKALMKQ